MTTEKRIILYSIEQNQRAATLRSNRLSASFACLRNGLVIVLVLGVLIVYVASFPEAHSGSSGIVYDKNRTLQAFGSEAPIRMDITDFRVVELSGNVVLATYRVSRFDTSFESIAHSLRSSVWRRSGDRWKIVFHQGTPTTASK